MNRLSILHPQGVQLLELESADGDSGIWRQIKPIQPKPVARTMEAGSGAWKWISHTRTFGNRTAHQTVTVHELQLFDGDGRKFSLGFFAKRQLPFNQYHFGYYGGTPLDVIKPGPLLMPRSNLVWSVQQSVDFTTAWVGAFCKSGGHLGGAGAEGSVGAIFKVTQPSDIRVIGITTGRLGIGLGGSVGIAVGVLTGFPSAESMLGHTENSWDFAVTVTAKWAAYLKFVGSSAAYADLARQLTRHGSLLKHAKSPKREVVEAARQLSAMGDIYKVVNTGEGSLKSKGPTVSLFDIPQLGTGLELGVFKTWSQVVKVE